MKHLIRCRFLPAVLCMALGMALVLGLTACGGKNTPPVETDGSVGSLSGSKGDSGVGVDSKPAEESLELLYDAMAFDDQYAGAVAYLGYREQGDSTPLSVRAMEICFASSPGTKRPC